MGTVGAADWAKATLLSATTAEAINAKASEVLRKRAIEFIPYGLQAKKSFT
jgi:hypothetical protein